MLLLASVLAAAPWVHAHALLPARIADNVYAFVSGGLPNAANRGHVANAGFIVGTRGVVVIDTGVSHSYGERMIEAIRAVTDRPVALVVVTHAVQEFVFGISAFEAIGAPVGAHRATVDLMRARCAHCLENLRPLLGEELHGSRLVLPGVVWDGPVAIEAGGETIELLHFGWAATPGDIAVFHRASGTLFAGGLASAGHVPEIRDCDFSGWQAALAALARLPVRHVVPGFGQPGDARVLANTAQYLATLDAQARSLYARMPSLVEALEHAALPAYARWAAYAQNHRRNVLHRYLQLEIEDFGGDPRSVALPQR